MQAVNPLAEGVSPRVETVSGAVLPSRRQKELVYFFVDNQTDGLLLVHFPHGGLEGVYMGFGLHVRWAIEGAIGSEYKVQVGDYTLYANFK